MEMLQELHLLLIGLVVIFVLLLIAVVFFEYGQADPTERNRPSQRPSRRPRKPSRRTPANTADTASRKPN